jgi:hypothetical protein
LGAGTVAGVGFTISLLVATLAFDGARLEEAKVGILGAAGGASVLTGLVSAGLALALHRATIPFRVDRTRAVVTILVWIMDRHRSAHGHLSASR